MRKDKNKVRVFNQAQADTTYLQGLGHVKGTPASELKPGDLMVWNAGVTTELVSIDKETKSFIWITERYKGQNFERKLKKDRIVARPANQLK